MSTPNGQSPNSNYFCYNCGTINTNGTRCIQCRSEVLEEIPRQTSNTERMSDNDNQQIPLIHQFQNLFNNDFNLQTFTNMLLPMLMSQIQPDLPQHRHRRGRPPRRIKRVTHTPLTHTRYVPSSFQAIHTPTSEIRLLNINELIPGQQFNTQLPFQLLIFDQNEENFNPEMLTQLLNEEMDILPVTRNDINQLPTLTSKLPFFLLIIKHLISYKEIE
jgi:hypothetical protein